VDHLLKQDCLQKKQKNCMMVYKKSNNKRDKHKRIIVEGKAEYNAGEPQGAKLMSKSQEKFNRLSVNEAKITKQLEGYQPEIL
jgi:hypothetical protein